MNESKDNTAGGVGCIAWLGITGMSGDTQHHWSDCSVHNEPAYPAGACDCGAVKARRKWWTWLCHRAGILVSHLRMCVRYRTAPRFRRR